MGEEKKQGELKKVLGLGDLMGIGIGQIIGSGIMSLTGICIALTGAGTPFAFLTAALLVLCPNMVLAVLGAAVPATGGMYTYVRDYIWKKDWILLSGTSGSRTTSPCNVCDYVRSLHA